ncbi:MAG TPA: dihydrodipicolinate synthase family protein [Clostridia bacterium]|nr:dihydrodipicolinate synthase family protein [Clostridia bacterium]
MNHLERLQGIFPPMATPFREQRLDLDAVKFNLERMNQTGVRGVMPLGSNGEFRAINDAESVKLIQTVRACLSPDKTLIAGAGRDSAYYTVETVKMIADAGADYVSVVTPHYFADKMSDDALCQYYEYVADRSPVPVLLYCVPVYAGGVVISYSAVKRLAQHDNIVGMKDTTKEDISGYIAAGQDGAEFHVLAGTIKKLLGGLKLGAVGGVLSVAVYLPQLCVDLWNLYQSGQMEAAEALSVKLISLSKQLTDTSAVSGVKSAMTLMGYYGGEPRLPLLPLTQEQIQQQREVLTQAGLLEGLKGEDRICM